MKRYYLLLLSAILILQTGAQDDLHLTLRVNYEISETIYRNEPVVFIISVKNKTAQSDQFWNLSAEKRMEAIHELVKEGKMKEEEAEAEIKEIQKQKIPVKSITLGSAERPWAEQLKWTAIMKGANQHISLPVNLLAYPATNAVLSLDGYKTGSAYFGISPENVQKTEPGHYLITVEWNQAKSEPVELIIKNATIPDAEMSREHTLLHFGRYYWHAGDGKKTLGYAEQMLKKNPASIEGHSLKGDAQFMLEYYLPALESYNQAVKEYFRQQGPLAEPPEYLFSMIGIIKQKLGEVKN